jgi:hypothetical protein
MTNSILVEPLFQSSHLLSPLGSAVHGHKGTTEISVFAHPFTHFSCLKLSKEHPSYFFYQSYGYKQNEQMTVKN